MHRHRRFDPAQVLITFPMSVILIATLVDPKTELGKMIIVKKRAAIKRRAIRLLAKMIAEKCFCVTRAQSGLARLFSSALRL